MKRLVVILILTALLALSVSAHVLPPDGCWSSREQANSQRSVDRFASRSVDQARRVFECDLSVSYPSMTWTTADWIRLRTPRRYPQKVHVPGIGARWVICQNNPIMFTDPTGMVTYTEHGGVNIFENITEGENWWVDFGGYFLSDFMMLNSLAENIAIANYHTESTGTRLWAGTKATAQVAMEVAGGKIVGGILKPLGRLTKRAVKPAWGQFSKRVLNPGKRLFSGFGDDFSRILKSQTGFIGHGNGFIDDIVESALRPSRAGSQQSRMVQALQKKTGNPLKNKYFEGLPANEETAERIIREVFESKTQVIRNGTNRNGQPYTDIFDETTGRGVRLIDKVFDTFVNID